ncbi:flavodoxin I [Hypnocyclicus thermotrophus]|uniref:Flavodoxin n=1 Tax=Hypnocyclicus thermotrophus TaxID=1627895 RepID=A0AA46E063_9FUSO|nr:flavodoxin [Hypnocyclicus thermotrophus]TDT72367.1 flavodoxin I [Hypnocyclicus thermotrophus]
MNKIAIYFTSENGITENVAYDIKYAFDMDIDIFDIKNKGFEEISKYDLVIFGTPTYGVGALPDAWNEKLQELKTVDLKGKYIALFGTGNQVLFHESFIDAVEKIYTVIKDKNIKLIGQTDTRTYNFEESKAILNNKFLGLAIDDINQADLSIERIENWVMDLKKELKI